MKGLFVTGTDTGVGKSVVAAAVCSALVARGVKVAAFKPVVTGLDEPSEVWPPDHDLLAAVTGQRPEEVTPVTFGPAVSPHLAAELDATRIDPAGLSRAANLAGENAEVLVCEGVGGLLVPLAPRFSVRDLAVQLGLPLVIAARPGLGTISHTLLTVEAARAAGLVVFGVVMTPWPAEPTSVQSSNRATVECLAQVAVSCLPPTSPTRLAEAGSGLPLGDWLGICHTPPK